jgi:hypothetical protein
MALVRPAVPPWLGVNSSRRNQFDGKRDGDWYLVVEERNVFLK